MIRWITDTLGTAPYYDHEKTSSNAETHVVDVRDLADRECNTADLILSKIQTVQRLLRDQRKVVVCCDKGISRSNAIALGVLMALGSSYHQALNQLLAADASDINLGLLHDVRALFDDHPPMGSIKNILITGSTGFIGRALTNGLRSKHEIFCLKKEELDLTRDLLLLDAFISKHNIGFIIHLAHPRNRANVAAMGESVAMMKNILEVCRLNKLGILYLSSLDVFSGYADTSVLQANSTTKVKPKGVYGESKDLCEHLISIYKETYGLEVVVLRPSLVYGMNMDRSLFISKFFEAAATGNPIRTHQYDNGLPVFDFLYLDDLVDAIRMALRIKPKVTLNIGTGKATSTYDAARMIVAITNSPATVETIAMAGTTSKIVVDPSEAATCLGWQAKVDLEQGLRKLWQCNASGGLIDA